VLKGRERIVKFYRFDKLMIQRMVDDEKGETLGKYGQTRGFNKKVIYFS
jgi:hypothetical protein